MEIERLPSETLSLFLEKKLQYLKKPKLIDIATRLYGCNDIKLPYSEFPKNWNQLSVKQLEKCCIGKFLQQPTKINEYIPIDSTFNFEKCAVCFDLLGRQKNSLVCGHWIHFKCIKSFSCPICRHNLQGTLPKNIESEIRHDILFGHLYNKN